ncbi:glycosyltransferase family 4 protein [Neptuniibacter sp. QD48_11]|uniref:glycosyltransferase family 4 protein n=1 Tax=unclassified Neptuniibacter TaxID=2630693 RepID=UPI0039F4B02C
MSKQILQLCLSPDLGGLELYMQRLSSYLNNEIGIHVAVAQNGKLASSLSENVDLKMLQLHRHAWKNIFKNAKQLATYIDTNKIDLIHLHWTKDLPVSVLAKKLSKRKPKLVQSRHMNMTRFKSDFYHRWLYKNLDLMIAVTKQVQEQITQYIPQEIRPAVRVSYIGAPTYQPLNKTSQEALKEKYQLTDSFVITLAGRIEPAKGQELLIDALQTLNNPNVKVMFIGNPMDDGYLKQFKKRIADKELSSQVVFTGFVSNVQDLMAISDCVVLATNKETFGMVLVEAMHTGTAVLASNSGGPLEIITPERDGLLFESQNSHDLSNKLATYIEAEDLRNKFAESGRQKALSKFDSQQQFIEVLNLLNNVTR